MLLTTFKLFLENRTLLEHIGGVNAGDGGEEPDNTKVVVYDGINFAIYKNSCGLAEYQLDSEETLGPIF